METVLIYGMTHNRGGIESYVMSLYRKADPERIRFDFVTDFPTMAYSDEVTKAGSLIHYIPSKSRSPLGHLHAFYKILKAHSEYKIIYFNILNAGAAFTMWVAKMLGRKCYVHSHNNSDGNMRLHNFFKKSLIKNSDKRLACSYEAAEFMFDTAENCEIINNAINTDDFLFSEEVRVRKRQELSLSDDAFAVLHVGRISPQKNPYMIIDIFSEILKIRQDAVLLYVGTGELDEQIKTYAKEKGASTNIRFLGMRSDVNELYSAADVFLFPSLYEGLGIVLIEAQTSGLRCFASDVIPKPTAITELISYISLDAPAEQWASEICDKATQNRHSRVEDVISAGYSINEVVDRTVDILVK